MTHQGKIEDVAADQPAAGGQLKRQLGSFEVLLLAMSCLSPVLSIFAQGGDVLQHTGTGAAALYLVGLAAAVVWALIYGELGSAYPYSGGEYVGVGSILGPWAGFASLTLWSVTAGPSCAVQAKTIASYMADMLPGVPADAVTFGSLAAATGVALLAVRTSTLITGLCLATEMGTVLTLIAAGLWHPARGLGTALLHPIMLHSFGGLGPVTLSAMALGGVSAVYATTGGNQAMAFGEELHEPHRRMGNVILMAGILGGLCTALPVIAVVLGIGDLPNVLQSPVPFQAFIVSVAGRGAGLALSAAVVVAVFNALVASIMFYARLFFSLGRDGIFHPAMNRALVRVHAATGVPRGATLLLVGITAACCLVSTHGLIVFLSGLTVYSLGLVSVALLVGRRRGLTGAPGFWRAPLYPLAPVLGLVLGAVFLVADLLDADAGRPSILLLGGMILAGLVWHYCVLRRRGWRPRVG